MLLRIERELRRHEEEEEDDEATMTAGRRRRYSRRTTDGVNPLIPPADTQEKKCRGTLVSESGGWVCARARCSCALTASSCSLVGLVLAMSALACGDRRPGCHRWPPTN